MYRPKLRGVARVRAEAGVLLVQLRARGAEQQERHAFRPVGDVLEEGQQRLVSPVQVFEDEHGLTRLGPRFEHAPPGVEGFRLRGRLGPLCGGARGKRNQEDADGGES